MLALGDLGVTNLLEVHGEAVGLIHAPRRKASRLVRLARVDVERRKGGGKPRYPLFTLP